MARSAASSLSPVSHLFILLFLWLFKSYFLRLICPLLSPLTYEDPLSLALLSCDLESQNSAPKWSGGTIPVAEV